MQDVLINDPAKEAILKTFVYKDVFLYPLTFFECYQYMIIQKPLEFDTFSRAFEEILDLGLIKYSRLETEKVKDKSIFSVPIHYHISSSSPIDRQSRNKVSKEYLQKARYVARLLSKIPSVLLVCVTGAVAAGNSPEGDDIDLLIVSTPGTLWITRFLCVLCLKVMGVYRTENNFDAKICPNIFLSADNLAWSRHRNVYTASELLLMKPVYDRSDYYFRFLAENLWVFGFFANMYASFSSTMLLAFSNEKKDFVHETIGERILKHLNLLVMKFQLWYMRNKKTVEVTEHNLIHFKKNDNLEWVLRSFEKGLHELKIQPQKK